MAVVLEGSIALRQLNIAICINKWSHEYDLPELAITFEDWGREDWRINARLKYFSNKVFLDIIRHMEPYKIWDS